MGTWVPTSSITLHWCSLLLAMSLMPCRAENPQMTSEFIRKAYSAIDNKKVMPFCFTRGLQNVFCFWESKSSDASKFTLNITLDSEVTCKLSTVNASEESWWHLCQFPQDYVSIFGLKPYIISVWDNESNKTLFWRNLTQEYVVYVEPPTKITVEEQKNPIGLLINFTNPETDQTLKDSIMYQVNYTSPKGDNSMTFNKDKVNSENGFVTLFLDDIKREAEYTIRVRAKADDPFDGYWSACAVTTYQTSNGFDEIHILLFVLAGIVVLTAIFLLAAYQRRFLKSKMWPDIPTPEHHFKELYTTHKGNFKTWLGQTDSYLTWISRNIFHEGPITTLEVLSELPNAPPSFLPPVPLPPKDSYVALDENILPPLMSWMVFSRQENVLRAQSNPADEGKSIRREGRPQEAEGSPVESEEVRQLTTAEEPVTDGTEIMTLKGLPSCRTILREDSLKSEEGKHSPASSFEYTVLETCDGLLSPRTRSIPPRQPLKYAYLLMSESGEESPPPSPNIYQNSICGQFPAPVYSQC
ncbi:erythropoietin receptor [Aquarana catesbeiana]|uniref:erythropoietin receptor n=1 Tax=Aquarana catesbeiana TaxID=8400 RepID=UPI003CC9718D